MHNQIFKLFPGFRLYDIIKAIKGGITMLFFVKLIMLISLGIIFTNFQFNILFYMLLVSLIGLEIIDKFFIRDKRKLKELEDGVRSISEGNLSKTFKLEGKGFREISRDLNRVLHNYRDALSQISYSTSRISGITHNLAQATWETNGAINEITRAIEEIALGGEGQKHSIDDLVGKIRDLMEILEETAIENKKAQEQWSKTNGAFIDTSNILGRLTSNMEVRMKGREGLVENTRSISEKIEEINNIVHLVKDISHQTNLLALNAAIEAARAGEYGQGFSVVAQEVGNLAEMAESATLNISEMVEEFALEIKALLDRLREEIIEEREDAELAKNTQSSFEEAGVYLEAIANVLDTTNMKMNRQLDEIDLIARNLEKVSHVSEDTVTSTQEISATMEEQVSSIDHISDNARTLEEMVLDLEKMVDQHSQVVIDESTYNKIVEDSKEIINKIRNHKDIKELNTSKHRDIYRAIIKENPRINIIYLYDTKGKLLSDSEDLEDIDITNREWFIEGLKQDIYVSDFYISYDTKKVSLTVSSQLKDKGTLLGVLGMDIEIES